MFSRKTSLPYVSHVFQHTRTIFILGRRISPRRMFDPGGTPGLVMGPCIVEIDRIVIRDVQYQLEVNRCRNEEVNVKQELVTKLHKSVTEKSIISLGDLDPSGLKPHQKFQGSSAYSVGGDSGQDGQTDSQTDSGGK
ncbi:hypothetical protein DPMN_133511 [Dreissena polymorpha]|uniref:Uncharacterized protein n=1 Tax=Dreissena polymorpha TaxID=45954 RepID=A0A9D4FX53_DREPO|nr:hypothetical protein DPMN_133511 [Dreissena polymorpha]